MQQVAKRADVDREVEGIEQVGALACLFAQPTSRSLQVNVFYNITL